AEQVFEPYVTTRRTGTGLGLSIVKKVVLDHGGEVGVRAHTAEPGVSFWIRLPLAENDDLSVT
ncbi:MAG: ATP-binding protein, partial [Nannocystaceae bacterium]